MFSGDRLCIKVVKKKNIFQQEEKNVKDRGVFGVTGTKSKANINTKKNMMNNYFIRCVEKCECTRGHLSQELEREQHILEINMLVGLKKREKNVISSCGPIAVNIITLKVFFFLFLGVV